MSIQISITSGKSGITIAINNAGTTCQGMASQVVSKEVVLGSTSPASKSEEAGPGGGVVVGPGSGGVHSAAAPRAGGGAAVPPGSGGGAAVPPGSGGQAATGSGSGVVVVGPIVVQPTSVVVPPGSGGVHSAAAPRAGGGAAVPPGSGGGAAFPPGSGGRIPSANETGAVVVGPILIDSGGIEADGAAVPPDSGGHLIIIVGTGDGPDATGQGTPTTVIGPIVISPPAPSATGAANVDSPEVDEDGEID